MVPLTPGHVVGSAGIGMGPCEGLAEGAADAVGLVEGAGDAVGPVEGAGESVGLDEGAVDTVGLAEGIADAVGLAEGAVEAVGLDEGAVDAVGLVEGAVEAVGPAEGMEEGGTVGYRVGRFVGGRSIVTGRRGFTGRLAGFGGTAGILLMAGFWVGTLVGLSVAHGLAIFFGTQPTFLGTGRTRAEAVPGIAAITATARAATVAVRKGRICMAINEKLCEAKAIDGHSNHLTRFGHSGSFDTEGNVKMDIG
jgi:hypothetical protein